MHVIAYFEKKNDSSKMNLYDHFFIRNTPK